MVIVELDNDCALLLLVISHTIDARTLTIVVSSATSVDMMYTNGRGGDGVRTVLVVSQHEKCLDDFQPHMRHITSAK